MYFDMARVNIEECWWSDPRRSKLIRIVGGDSRLADGLVMAAWRLAQEFWKHERTLIPLAHFENLEDYQFLIQAKLAEIREDKVYIRGSSQYLDWTYEKKEAGKKGGEESAKRERDEKGHFLPKYAQAESKQSPSKVQAVPSASKPLPPIPIPIPILVPSSSVCKIQKFPISSSIPILDTVDMHCPQVTLEELIKKAKEESRIGQEEKTGQGDTSVSTGGIGNITKGFPRATTAQEVQREIERQLSEAARLA